MFKFRTGMVRGIDTLLRETTLSKLFYFLSEIVFSEWKEYALGSKFFSFRVGPFS